MSIALNFPIATPLRESMDAMKQPLALTRALVVTIDNETLVLSGTPVEATTDLGADLATIRKQLTVDHCAFVLIKLDEKQFSLVMYIPEGTKPKVKMQYAGSSAHLRDASLLAIGTDTHIVHLDELAPTLFGRDIVAERKELMTSDEVVRAEIDKMEIAPQKPVGLPGVANPLEEEALVAVLDLKQKKLRAATFVVTAKGTIAVEKKSPLGSSDDAASWASLLSAEEPRFAIINWKDTDSVVLLYVCPEGCKPKLKMPYATSKASFVAQLAHQELKPKKSVEVGSVADAATAIEEALNAPQLDEEVKPIAPRSIMPKGPRMLI